MSWLSTVLALALWPTLMATSDGTKLTVSKEGNRKEGLVSLPLRPTSTLLLQDHRALLQHAGRNSGVYASIARVKESDEDVSTQRYNALVHEFNRDRHVNRWGGQYEGEKQRDGASEEREMDMGGGSSVLSVGTATTDSTESDATEEERQEEDEEEEEEEEESEYVVMGGRRTLSEKPPAMAATRHGKTTVIRITHKPSAAPVGEDAPPDTDEPSLPPSPKPSPSPTPRPIEPEKTADPSPNPTPRPSPKPSPYPVQSEPADDHQQEDVSAGGPTSAYADIIDVVTKEKEEGEPTDPFQDDDERDAPGGTGSEGGNDDTGDQPEAENAVLDSYFQSAPLYQGIGTHYASVWVGEPDPQRVSLIVDTSSHHTVFPCEDCRDCGTHAEDYFDSQRSETFHRVACDECQFGSKCSLDRCIMKKTSGPNTWQAYQAIDTMFCGAADTEDDASQQGLGFQIDFMFGCITSDTGWYKKMLASGIMGLSQDDDTLVKRMYMEGVIEHNLYSLCLRRELQASAEGIVAGVLTMGGVDPRMHTSGVAYARSLTSSGYYTVKVKRVYLRHTGGLHSLPDSDPEHHLKQLTELPVDQKRLNGDKGIIINSGAVDSFLDPSMEAIFQQVFERLCGLPYEAGQPVILSNDQVQRLPTLLLQLQAFEDRPDPSVDYTEPIAGLVGSEVDPHAPHDVLIAIPAMHYMEYDPDNDQYTPRIYFAATGGGVLGANVMQGHDVIFDWESGRIGFAESPCFFEELDFGDDDIYKDAEDDDDTSGHGKAEDSGRDDEQPQNPLDCRVGPMVQSSTCEENANVDKCNGDESAQVRTVEKWARVVEDPGSMNGKSCEDVIMDDDPNMIGGTAIGCNGNGVCQIFIPCTADCSVLMSAGTSVEENDETNPSEGASDDDEDVHDEQQVEKVCGENLWGSCGFSCEQSRVVSVLRKDGVCHKGEIKTRPCHIDACGRFEPCIVPFVVHSILGFFDGNADAFHRDYHQRFAEAFSATVNKGITMGDIIHFGAGDVKVMHPSNWYHEEEEVWDPVARRNKPKKKGMKLIAEIAVFNPDIDPPTSDSQMVKKENGVIRHVTNKVKASLHPPTHIDCEEKDNFPMAKVALDVHKVLEGNDFMKNLIMELKNLDHSTPRKGDDDDDVPLDSPFSYVYEKESRVEKSEMISSWTVKTETKDPITLSDEHVLDEPIVVTLLVFMAILFVCMCACGVGLAAVLYNRDGLGHYKQIRPRSGEGRDDDEYEDYDDDDDDDDEGYDEFVDDDDDGGIQMRRIPYRDERPSSPSYRDTSLGNGGNVSESQDDNKKGDSGVAELLPVGGTTNGAHGSFSIADDDEDDEDEDDEDDDGGRPTISMV